MGTLKEWLKLEIPTIGITGGKGGTGKTTVATNLTQLLVDKGKDVLLVDFDVDAPNTGILLGASLQKYKDVTRFLPKFLKDKCIFCGDCSRACREHAILAVQDTLPLIFPEVCAGCGACRIACKHEAIAEDKKIFGALFEASPNKHLDMIVGELKLGEARSAVVVEDVKARVLEKAKERKYDFIIIDTAPGAHCDVLRALYGVQTVLCVTEPTPFGSHDLERILILLKTINTAKNVHVILNRSDLIKSNSLIEKAASKFDVNIISSIPNDIAVLESHSLGLPVVKHAPQSKAAMALKELVDKLEVLA
ncbi:MAG: nucleotide-binding protein [Candidatus Helarchaeota archaeon]